MNEKVTELLRKVSKKTKSPIAKELMKEKEFEAACSLAYQLFTEAVDEFKDGSMTWKEAVDDLYANLKALEMPEPEKGESDDDGE